MFVTGSASAESKAPTRLFLLLWAGSFAAHGADLRLAQAAQNRNAQAVTTLVEQHADVNAPGLDGATALAWAAHWDDLKTARVLIHAGANANIANDYGVTPLWLACENGGAAMVETLLEAGANPNALGLPSGETALLRCAGTGNAEAVKSLLAHGADVNAKEIAGQSPLMWALEERHPEVVRILIDHHADVNAVSLGGFTPLLFAARQGDVDSGRLLLEKGAKIDASLQPTAGRVSSASAKGLLWFGHPESMDALLLAIHSGREKFAIFLVEQGANPNVVDAHGMTALHYALQQGISDLDGSSHDPRYGALDFLFRPNMTELVQALLEHGANPNARILKRVNQLTISERPKINLTGATPFLLAAATGDVKLMKLLVARGANPLLSTDDGTTPLMAAAGIGRSEDRPKEDEGNALEALKLTLELGGDVNAANRSGLTAMHGAASTGSDDIIQFLVDRGARLDVRDKFGETPLSIASGDPNGLAEDAYRRVHPATEALLRKLTGDHASLVSMANSSPGH
jgi:ankyrin repeat protein